MEPEANSEVFDEVNTEYMMMEHQKTKRQMELI